MCLMKTGWMLGAERRKRNFLAFLTEMERGKGRKGEGEGKRT